jgi:hypothetical protein
MDDKNRRRQHWIDPRFQGKYLLQILGLELLVAVVTMVMTLALVATLFSSGFEHGLGWNRIFYCFVGMLILSSAVMTWIGVRVTHRICGPVYRMRQDLVAIRVRSSERPIKLRDGDEFQDLADEINRTVDYLKNSR